PDAGCRRPGARPAAWPLPGGDSCSSAAGSPPGWRGVPGPVSRAGEFHSEAGCALPPRLIHGSGGAIARLPDAAATRPVLDACRGILRVRFGIAARAGSGLVPVLAAFGQAFPALPRPGRDPVASNAAFAPGAPIVRPVAGAGRQALPPGGPALSGGFATEHLRLGPVA